MTPPTASKGGEARRRLFAAPLREFIHQRDALARELRGSGAMEEARALAGLRKPSVALWIANQLARLSPGEVKALIEATARLRQRQSSAPGGSSSEALREAMRDQREALARLTEAAGRAAREADTTLTMELQRRVQNTVQSAAASDPEALREGMLEKELQPSGFEELLAVAPAPDTPKAQPATPSPDGAPARKKTQDDAREREREAAAARAREKELARALQKAEQEAQRLEAEAKKLAELADAKEQEAARAREQADGARRAAETAAARAEELRGK